MGSASKAGGGRHLTVLPSASTKSGVQVQGSTEQAALGYSWQTRPSQASFRLQELISPNGLLRVQHHVRATAGALPEAVEVVGVASASAHPPNENFLHCRQCRVSALYAQRGKSARHNPVSIDKSQTLPRDGVTLNTIFGNFFHIPKLIGFKHNLRLR